MRLGAPGFLWFLICLVLGALAVASRFTYIQFVTPNQFWFAVAAWGLLSFGCLFRISRA
ncbi:MAG TPA: hypothetical protein VIF14_11280 [Alphaproteobacteria bacterium]|jgi:hypothetical protein